MPHQFARLVNMIDVLEHIWTSHSLKIGPFKFQMVDNNLRLMWIVVKGRFFTDNNNYKTT